MTRFLRWLTPTRDENRPACGVAPERSNLHSLAERRALRVLETLTPRVCRFCGERTPSHDTNCPNHAWSHRGFDNAPWEGLKGD